MSAIKNIFNSIAPKKVKQQVIKMLPVRDLHGFPYTVEELVGMWENSHWAVNNWHGKILNSEILNYKKSDTIFILGSGPSINDITKKQWNVIANNDSIGFNWWFVHDFVPTFYVFQSAHDQMLKILEDKYLSYKNVPFLIRGSAFARGSFDFSDKRFNLLKTSPVYFVNEYPISASCAIKPDLLYRYMDALGLMTYGEIAPFIPKWRGTLGLLISLAYQMGYKNIVLCGMDMHNADHFWDYPPYNSLKQKYDLPGVGHANIKTFTDTKTSPNTVPVYVYTLSQWMTEKNNVSVFIANQSTVLYPRIETYNF